MERVLDDFGVATGSVAMASRQHWNYKFKMMHTFVYEEEHYADWEVRRMVVVPYIVLFRSGFAGSHSSAIRFKDYVEALS